MNSLQPVREVANCQPETVEQVVASGHEPLHFKALVRHWPVVQAAHQSPQAVADYILKFYSGNPVTAFVGAPDINGRVGYNHDLSGFNYQQGTTTLNEFLAQLLEHASTAKPPAYYMGSTLLDRWFPGFRAENNLVLSSPSQLASMWIGNRVKISAHFDVADNIACNVAGRRKFTVFPPDQLDNLYIGPWDRTPAGQAISLVDFDAPDFEKYPKFRDALAAARTVTLEPGDAIYIPSMWWHHVEGLDHLNVLVNYWWRSTPRFLGSPLAVFKHALLELRELPEAQRRAWQHIFDHYVFDPKDDATAHIPEHSKGILGNMDNTSARQLRAELLNLLNR